MKGLNKKEVLLVFGLLLTTLNSLHAQNTIERTETTLTKKNILMIVVDDLKPLLSNYGHPEMKTPNFDRLADMGMTFTNAHVQYAVCGPSRASAMTGTNPDRTKVWDLHTNFRISAPDLISMPEYLISQGYETVGIGKIYHKGSASAGHDRRSWSFPYEIPENFNHETGAPVFTYYQDPQTKAKIKVLLKEIKAKGSRKRQLRKEVFKRIKPSTEAVAVADDAYLDGLYAQQAIQKLKELSKMNAPWFLAIGFQKPHLPFVAPKKYWDLYNREEIVLAKFQQLTKGTPRYAYHNFGELRSYSDIDNNLKVGQRIEESKQRELIHGYRACVSYIDAQIGKILNALEKQGILKETVIVLWGDHGWHLGDHTEWCKHSNFEQATRIPFMFVGPGIQKGAKSHYPVNLVDMFPTLFQLANVPPSKQCQGKSLYPLLDKDPTTQLDENFAHHQYKRKNIMGYAIRNERYRYTEWHDNNYRSYLPYVETNIVGRELYDYKVDSLETINLVNSPEYKRVVEKMKETLKNYLTNQK